MRLSAPHYTNCARPIPAWRGQQPHVALVGGSLARRCKRASSWQTHQLRQYFFWQEGYLPKAMVSARLIHVNQVFPYAKCQMPLPAQTLPTDICHVLSSTYMYAKRIFFFANRHMPPRRVFFFSNEIQTGR
jgi:hypothetical protein